MKTAVSLPDDLYARAERYAQRTRKTRSQVYSDALRQYLLQHTPDAVTEAMNQACDAVAPQHDRFPQAAARRILRQESW